MKFIALSKLDLVGLMVCVVAASLLRFYQLGTTYNFAGDQGRDALVMLQLDRGQSFPRKGPSTSVGNFNLGPFFYYFMAPSLAISGFDPLGPAMFEAFLGVLTTAVIFLFLRQKVSLMTALIAALLYAMLPTFVSYDRFAWNPNSIPLFFMGFIWSLSEFWKKWLWWSFAIALLMLAILLQLHLLTMVLVVPLLVTLWWPEPKKMLRSLGYTLIALVVSTLSLAPFIVGLLRAHASSGTIIQLQPITVVVRLITEKVTTLQLLGGQNLWLIFVAIVLILAGLINIFLNTKKEWKLGALLVVSTILTWLSLSLLNARIETHYLFVPLVSLIVISAFGLDWLSLRIKNVPLRYSLVFFLVVSWVYFWLPQWQALLTPKWVEVSVIKRTDDQIVNYAREAPFQVAVLTEFSSDDPYVYFLTAERQKIVRAPQTAEQLFVICEAANKCQIPNNPHVEILTFKAAHKNQNIQESMISNDPPIYRIATDSAQ